MLGSPCGTDPIIDTTGNEWIAVDHLDVFNGKMMTDIKKLLCVRAETVPEFVGKMVEIQLRLDFEEDPRRGFESSMKLLREFHFSPQVFDDEQLREVYIREQERLAASRIDEWEKLKVSRRKILKMAELPNGDFKLDPTDVVHTRPLSSGAKLEDVTM